MVEWYPKRRLGDLPAEAAARWPEREHLAFEGRRWTFREFAAEVDRAAKGLIAIGVEPGEKCAIWMTNRPEWLFLMYAIPRAGGVLVPLNTRYRTEDFAYTIAQSNSASLFAIDRSGPVDYLAMLREAMPDVAAGRPNDLALARFSDLKRVVFVGQEKLPNTLSWDEMIAAGARVSDAELRRRAEAVDPDDLAMIIYTSGTTGHPKGVMHSHIPIRNVEERGAILGRSFTDVEVNYLPLFHAYGLTEVALMSLLFGSRQVLTPTFDAEEILDLVEAEGVSMLHGFEAHWTDLLNAQARRARRLDSLRLGTFASGVENTVPVCYRANEVFCPTVSGFGMSETCAFVAVSPPTATPEQRCAGSGYPMPGYAFRVVDPETEREQPPGVPGELRAKGYAVTRGYYNKPEATAELFDAEGWLRTGDMAHIRPDGHLVFMGRHKDMLKVGGENVSPAEIELYLMQIPEIAEVSVVGYPDARLSEVAVAFIRLKPGAELTETRVIAFCKGKIAGFKVPRHVLFVEEFPMTPSGKVQKVKLRAQALDMLGAGAAARRSAAGA
jgi:fatty-acyl-CoA synthase